MSASALIVTADGFEDSEFTYPYYRLQEAEVDVDVATPDGAAVSGKHGLEFEADLAIADVEADEYDLLVVPGGDAPETLRTDAPEAADLVAAFDDADRPIASICHGAQLLISADVVAGRYVTGYRALAVDIENAGGSYVDEELVTDDNLFTSRTPDDLPAFGAELVDRAEAGAEPEAST